MGKIKVTLEMEGSQLGTGSLLETVRQMPPAVRESQQARLVSFDDQLLRTVSEERPSSESGDRPTTAAAAAAAVAAQGTPVGGGAATGSIMERYLREQGHDDESVHSAAYPARAVSNQQVNDGVTELLRGPSDASHIGLYRGHGGNTPRHARTSASKTLLVTADDGSGGEARRAKEQEREDAKLLTGKYPAKAHLAKVAAFLDRPLKSDFLLMAGSKEIARGSTDQNIPFEQESNFYYALGDAEWPGWVLLYQISTMTLTVYVPQLRKGRDIAYLGQVPSVEQVKERYDVDRAFYLDKLGEAFISDVGGLQFYTADDPDVVRAFAWARVTKDAYERALLRKASKISALAHVSVAKHLREYKGELEAETQFVASCRTRHSDAQQAYGPIMASGRNAAVLHYGRNDQSFSAPSTLSTLSFFDKRQHGRTDGDAERRQMILIDAGAQYQRYASDVTRTYPLSLDGRFNDRSLQIYRLVLAAQTWAIDRLKPGVKMSTLQRGVHEQVLAPGIVELGLVNVDVVVTRELNLTGAFMMHGLGHHVGLDVHDVTPLRRVKVDAFGRAAIPGYSPTAIDDDLDADDPLVQLRQAVENIRTTPKGVLGAAKVAQDRYAWQEVELSEHMCVTIEPGVYFNQEFLDLFRRRPNSGSSPAAIAGAEDQRPRTAIQAPSTFGVAAGKPATVADALEEEEGYMTADENQATDFAAGHQPTERPYSARLRIDRLDTDLPTHHPIDSARASAVDVDVGEDNDGVARYFNWDRIDSYLDVGGVRIEDTLLVTAKGSENLSKAVVKEIREIEALVGGTGPRESVHHGSPSVLGGGLNARRISPDAARVRQRHVSDTAAAAAAAVAGRRDERDDLHELVTRIVQVASAS